MDYTGGERSYKRDDVRSNVRDQTLRDCEDVEERGERASVLVTR